ncbi:MAG: biotin--[acetyl-CoA-carboxylase] ligase [Armatimonadota bacterium]
MSRFGKPTFVYESVGSTMTVAADLVHSGTPAGTVVRARRQTAGKGRRGRTWAAPADANVNCTLVCPVVGADRRWELAPLAGVAVADALALVAPTARPGLRFPNDVMLKGRKCAGVLVESALSAEGVVPLVGIGINIRKGALPPDVAVRAIALEEVVGNDCSSVEAVAEAVVEAFGRWWDLWRE